jgi:hypothetical protein
MNHNSCKIISDLLLDWMLNFRKPLFAECYLSADRRKSWKNLNLFSGTRDGIFEKKSNTEYSNIRIFLNSE